MYLYVIETMVALTGIERVQTYSEPSHLVLSY